MFKKDSRIGIAKIQEYFCKKLKPRNLPQCQDLQVRELHTNKFQNPTEKKLFTVLKFCQKKLSPKFGKFFFY
jgi:hypothetical protein